ncbi:MAG: glycosyltransferase [bacterium]|nr:glycosyltransferase [bacterium]
MKLLHITPYYAPAYAYGGVVRAVEGMARALAGRGHQVTVLTTDALSRDAAYTGSPDQVIDGVRVVRARNAFPRVRARYNLSTPLAMRQLAPALIAQADAVHVHELRTAEALIAAPLCARHGKPLILSPHGTLSYDAGAAGLKRLWDWVFSPAVARRTHTVIGLTADETAEAARFWARFGAAAAFHTVPNGVNAEEWVNLPGGEAFRARHGLGAAPLILFLGRLHPRKGIGVLIQAFQRAGIPDARLVIAGPDEGVLDGLRAQPDPSVILTGYLDDAGRKAALAAADVFVLPALAGEGLPMAALEALAAGVPVVLSPACHLPEVVDYQAGRIVEPEPDALAAALRDLVADRAALDAMRTQATRLIRDRFPWGNIAQALEMIYGSAQP